MERRKQRTLSMVQNARLVNLIEAEFAASKMTDEAFAAHASEKIGAEVTKQHIHNRRQELGIPSFRETRDTTPGDLLAVSERLTSVETQLAGDQRELQGLATALLEMKRRIDLLEKAVRLKGQFEPLEPLRAARPS